jgi:hypothetical protein
VTDGLFSVELDFGGDVFAGQARWLEVAVQCTGDTSYTTLGRQALTATPQALYALDADRLDGQQASAFADAFHDHLGETWVGIDNPQVISGTFGAPDYAPLVLNNSYSYGNGLRVDSAGGDGVYVRSAGGRGVLVGLAGSPSGASLTDLNDGFGVAGAEGNGLFVGRADLNGVSVGSAGDDGVYVGRTGNPSVHYTSAYNNGVEIAGAEGHGLYVGRADMSGVDVGSASHYGVRVNSAGSHGLSVASAGSHGVDVFMAGEDGVYVHSAGNPSVHYTSVLSNGVEIAGAEGNGLYVGQADEVGVYVESAGDPSLRYSTWSGSGFEVAGAEAYGLYVGRADMSGVHVRTAGHNGISIGQVDDNGVYVEEAGAYGFVVRSATQDYFVAGDPLVPGWPDFRVLNTGEVQSDVGFNTPASDFAEMMTVEGDRASYEPGDVLVIGDAQDRAVALSSSPYSQAVIGVHSTAPGFVGGHPVSDDDPPGSVPVTVLGIVPCKATTENGPIRRGDLLVTSATPGHAMRADEPPPGTILGKALEPLDASQDTGVILVLVTLQ